MCDSGAHSYITILIFREHINYSSLFLTIKGFLFNVKIKIILISFFFHLLCLIQSLGSF